MAWSIMSESCVLSPWDKIHTDTLDAVLSLNLHPALLTVQAVLPTLRAKRWGRIVNISSLTILGAARAKLRTLPRRRPL